MIAPKVCFLKILPVLGLATFAQAQAPVGTALKAEVYIAKSAPFAQTVSTVGSLRANESVALTSELSRRLLKIQFQEGADVAAGDALFKLDDSDLVSQLAEIDARIALAKSTKARAA